MARESSGYEIEAAEVEEDGVRGGLPGCESRGCGPYSRLDAVLMPSARWEGSRLRSRSLKVAADRETIRELEAVFGKGRVGLVKV